MADREHSAHDSAYGSAHKPPSILGDFKIVSGNSQHWKHYCHHPHRESARDPRVHTHFSSLSHGSLVDQRVHYLGLRLANKIFITGKNERGQSIFEDLFEALPPNVPKGQGTWLWGLQLDGWKAFINAQGRDNEGEFYSLLQIFFKDNRVRKFLNESRKRSSASRARKIMWQTVDDPDKYGWRDFEVLWELKKNKMEIDSER